MLATLEAPVASAAAFDAADAAARACLVAECAGSSSSCDGGVLGSELVGDEESECDGEGGEEAGEGYGLMLTNAAGRATAAGMGWGCDTVAVGWLAGTVTVAVVAVVVVVVVVAVAAGAAGMPVAFAPPVL
jgi:hypothetical protein